MTSRYSDKQDTPAGRFRALERCAREANAILGTAEVRMEGLPANRFDTVPLLDVVKAVEAVVTEAEPRVVLTSTAATSTSITQ